MDTNITYGLKLFGSICHIFHMVSQFVMLIIKMVAKTIKVFITFLCIKSQSLKIKTNTMPMLIMNNDPRPIGILPLGLTLMYKVYWTSFDSTSIKFASRIFGWDNFVI